MRKPSLSFTVVAALLALGCQKDLTNPGGGGGPNSMVAQVTATDVSRPTGPGATPVDIVGTVTFTGVTVELWNGAQWLSVANGSGSASVKVGDGAASATLVPASEIPAGDYTKARFAATNAAVDITLDGQSFSARVGNPSLGPIEIEKTISVSVNPDGSRTFSIQLELIRSVSLRAGSNGAVVDVSGELGAMSVPATTAPGIVSARDVSHPVDESGAPVNVSGTVNFTGLSVELWDGAQWLSVANGSGSATVNVGDGTASATLVPASAIPAGDYTKARVSATNATVDITLNGQNFSARSGNSTLGPIVIEKTVSVSINPDGSRTFSIELEMIRSVSLRGGINGTVVEVSGDLGAMSIPAEAAPGMVSATDVSQPVDGSGAPVNVSGTVSFTGLSVELWDGSRWLSVVDGAGSADVTIGDGAASATLVPATAIAAGEYSKVRIAAKETVAQLTATVDGQEVAAQLRAPSDRPFVVEKAVTVTVNADGSRTFSVQLELVRTVDVSTDPITGAPRLDVTGELVGR